MERFSHALGVTDPRADAGEWNQKRNWSGFSSLMSLHGKFAPNSWRSLAGPTWNPGGSLTSTLFQLSRICWDFCACLSHLASNYLAASWFKDLEPGISGRFVQHHGKILSQLSDIPVLFIIPMLESTPFIFYPLPGFPCHFGNYKKALSGEWNNNTPLKCIDIFWAVRAFAGGQNGKNKRYFGFFF